MNPEFFKFESYDLLVVTVGCLSALTLCMVFKTAMSNIGHRLLLAVQKPFRVGDTIRVEGTTGRVKSISLFSTLLVAPDDTTVFLPHARLFDSHISNFNDRRPQRVDLLFRIDRARDIEAATDIIEEVLVSDARVHEQPPPLVTRAAHSGEGIYLIARACVFSCNYWEVMLDTTEKVKKQFVVEEVRGAGTCEADPMMAD